MITLWYRLFLSSNLSRIFWFRMILGSLISYIFIECTLKYIFMMIFISIDYWTGYSGILFFISFQLKFYDQNEIKTYEKLCQETESMNNATSDRCKSNWNATGEVCNSGDITLIIKKSFSKSGLATMTERSLRVKHDCASRERTRHWLVGCSTP